MPIKMPTGGHLVMAVSSTTAALHITRHNFLATTAKSSCLSSDSLRFASKQRRLIFIINNSGDAAPETTAPAEVEESDSSIEVPEGPPSLISALNVERALRGIPITDADHYGRLGIPVGCSYEQVSAGYRNKVDELLNEGLDEEELSKKMELLKESYAILSSTEERRFYDWSLVRSESPDRYTWPFEVDTIKPPPGPPPPQEPEDVGPTRLVGYFFLAWIILSFILSIVLYR